MPVTPHLDESKRKRALKLLDETDPELAKTFREELKKRKNEVEDNKDFKRRIASFTNRYKPKLRYARLSDPVLLYFWALLEQRITGCIADIVARYFNPVAIFLPGKKFKSDVSKMHKWPLPVLINEFHDARVDEQQTFQLVRLVLERTALLMEYEKRMASRIIGRELLHPSEIKRLQELLGVEKLQTWRPKKEDSDDLRSLAIAKAVEKYAHQCTYLVDKPLQKVPRFPVRDGAQWDNLHRDRYQGEVKPALKRLLPVLYGTSESIKGDVHEALRNHWEQWEAQMRTGEEVDLQEGQKILRREGRIQASSEDLDERVDVSYRMFRVLQEAKKRWGAKAVAAIKYFLEGKTEQEAAELAGITDRTFRNYQTRLRKILSSKK
jgi:hypothetical protein